MIDPAETMVQEENCQVFFVKTSENSDNISYILLTMVPQSNGYSKKQPIKKNTSCFPAVFGPNLTFRVNKKTQKKP